MRFGLTAGKEMRMYLKSLVIQGFKSFPDKTVLQFGEEITAIVGPNGSGKSNISDAIRWVMGEQSSKNLRGTKMEDVIFGGTEKRGAVGFAQVTLVLDNSAHIFPAVDSPEVMVTRRYYRSGESEYYINRQAVRLKDINELFMDTGLGREGYSIIGQGRIDEILSVKSGDRREIFEEAAGISKFRHRKEETERKLERTEENLVRVSDKIAELELQVGPLQEQAEKAKRYLVLRDELRVLEISVWLSNLEELKTKARKLETDYAAAVEQQAAVSQARDELYAATERFAQRMRQNDMDQEAERGQIAGLESQISQQESASAVLNTRLQHNGENMERLRAELSDQESRDADLEEQIDQQRRRLETIRVDRERLEEELAALTRQVQDAAEGNRSAAQEAQRLRGQEALAVAAAADARAERSALAAGIAQMEQRRGEIGAELAAAQKTLEEKRAEAKRCRRALEDAQEEAAAAANVIAGHTLKLEGREKRHQAAQDRKMKLTMDRQAMADRIALLTEMEKEYEGFNKAVRLVMQAAEKRALRGIHGPIASLMRTEDRYTVALEVALGAGMQNMVVDREEDAKSAIQFLKQRDGGRATFLPLTAIRGEELRERGLESEPGFVGLASRLVRFDENYRQIFQNLLGRTAVVEDLDCGIAMARKFQNRFRIVTLDGQIINRGGAMTGGSVSRSAGILSRANELGALRGKLADLDQTLAGVVQEEEEARRALTAARYAREVAEEQQRAAQDEVLRRQGEKGQYDVLLETLEGSAAALQGERESLAGRLAEAGTAVERKEQEIAAHEADAEAFRRQAEERLAGQTGLQELTAALGEDITTHKSDLAALSAEAAAAERSTADLEKLRDELMGDRASRETLLEEYRRAGEEMQAELQRRAEQTAQLRLEAQEGRKRLEELGQEKLSMERERTASDRALKERNETLLNIEREVSRLEQRKATSAMEESQILDKLWERYELSHSAAMEQRVELESVPKAARRIGELKREIGALGNVNIGAIDEFERVNTRYTYLTGQRDDVERAKGELTGIIQEITREMTGIFSQQFALISETFQTTFVELFGGGTATLELEDPEDILNCGIEIKAQPPGKTLKTITLLSGGEKAFVAIALYFAILKVHPTPFCVMDEIEAALDEANVVRFARYMRTLSDKTQFIVITHRRGTMEESDVLYGVTMQEKGVSKMLMINMNEMARELKIE